MAPSGPLVDWGVLVLASSGLSLTCDTIAAGFALRASRQTASPLTWEGKPRRRLQAGGGVRQSPGRGEDAMSAGSPWRYPHEFASVSSEDPVDRLDTAFELECNDFGNARSNPIRQSYVDLSTPEPTAHGGAYSNPSSPEIGGSIRMQLGL